MPARLNLGHRADADRASWRRRSAELRALLALEPANAEAAYNLGLALKQQDDFAGAETELRKAVATRSDAAGSTLHARRACSGRQAAPDEALEQFREALARKPDYADAFYMIGTMLKQQGALAEAIVQFKEAIKHRPLSAEAHLSLGQALSQLGDKAGRRVGAGGSRPPQSQNGRRAGLDVRGQRRRAEGRRPATIAAAIAQFREAIRLADDNPQAHYQLALALRRTGARAEAQTHFDDGAPARALSRVSRTTTSR